MPSVSRSFFFGLLLFLCLAIPARGESLHEGDEPFPGVKLTRYLGRGGFGEAWEADHDGKKIALKFVKSGEFGIVETKAYLMMREVGEHPNILKYDKAWAWNKYIVLSSDLA